MPQNRNLKSSGAKLPSFFVVFRKRASGPGYFADSA